MKSASRRRLAASSCLVLGSIWIAATAGATDRAADAAEGLATLQQLADRLELTSGQREALRPILEEHAGKLGELRMRVRSGKTERWEAITEMRTRRSQLDAKV